MHSIPTSSEIPNIASSTALTESSTRAATNNSNTSSAGKKIAITETVSTEKTREKNSSNPQPNWSTYLSQLFSYSNHEDNASANPLKISLLSDYEEEELPSQGILQKKINETLEAQGLYQTQLNKAQEEGNNKEGSRYELAHAATNIALNCFKMALEKNFSSEEIRAAHSKSGEYSLQSAYAHAAGDLEKAANYSHAASMTTQAADYFGSAKKEGISLEEVDAYRRAAHYLLQGAHFQAEGNKEKGAQLHQGGTLAAKAALYFHTAVQQEIFKEAADAYKATFCYLLQEADAQVKGDQREITTFRNAAATAEKAIHFFSKAAQAKSSLKAATAYRQAAYFLLQEAEARAHERTKKTKHLVEARNEAEKTAEYFESTDQQDLIFLDERKIADTKIFDWSMQVAQETAEGNLAKAGILKKALNELNDALSDFYSSLNHSEKSPFPEVKEAHCKAFYYKLQKAEAIKNKEVTTDSFTKAEEKAKEAAVFLERNLSLLENEEATPPTKAKEAYCQAFRYRMQIAQALAEKKEQLIIVQYEQAVSLTEDAGWFFFLAHKQGIDALHQEAYELTAECLSKEAQARIVGQLTVADFYKKAASLAKQAVNSLSIVNSEEGENQRHTAQGKSFLQAAKALLKQAEAQKELELHLQSASSVEEDLKHSI